MIEIICKEDSAKENRDKKEKNISLPKNIRQVGSPRGRHKIYVEDYVYTYLRNMAKEQEKCAAVFLGNSQVEKDIRYTFISGVIECSGAVFQWDSISLDESFWDYIYKEEKQYFPELEIVGWFLGKAGQAMELPPAIEAAHRKYFSGRDKLLMLMDILEEEERFFVYEQGYLQKREGYYIYYEKNLSMQEYMISKREEERLREEQRQLQEEQQQEECAKEIPELISESRQEASKEETPEVLWKQEEPATEKKESTRSSERDARAMLDQMRRQEKRVERKIREGTVRQKGASPGKIFVKSNLEEPKTQAEEALDAYRRMALERQGARRQRQSRNLLYTASSFLMVVICVIGITTINNYRKMQEVEEVLRMISPKTPASGNEDSKGNDGLVVETVESQVEPLEDSGEAAQETRQSEQGPAEGAQEAGQKDEQDGSTGKSQTTDAAEDNMGNTGTTDAAGKNPGDTGAEDTADTRTEDTAESSSKDNTSGGQSDQIPQDGSSKNPQQDGGPGNTGESGNTQETSSLGQTGEPRYYTVQPGDTLNTICLELYHNKDMAQKIKELNQIEDGDKILVGQKLLLP